MRRNYKRLGDYIELVDERNKDLTIDLLLGLTINKQFIPSVANTVGTNMKNYKIIRKNQFACSTMQVRRDRKMPIAILKDFDEAIISQAYPVFKIIDEQVLNPDYLMMWFARQEFDRQATFHAVGGVRGSIEWVDFLDFELPIPSIEKQREIVAEYQAVENKIKTNEQICEKLEAAAQALYKHWFIDFEFPNEEDMPYKSSGGAMVYNEELEKEIPEGWGKGYLESLCVIIDGDRGRNYPKKHEFSNSGYCLFLNAGNVTNKGFNFTDCSFITKEKDDLLRKGKLKVNDIVLTSRGTVGNLAYFTKEIPYEHIRINSGMLILRSKNKPSFLYSLLKSNEFTQSIKNYISGSAVPQLPIRDLNNIEIILPDISIINKYSNEIIKLFKGIDNIKKQNQKLSQLQSLMLSQIVKKERSVY